MKQAIVTTQDDRVALKTPFDREFLSDLKSAIADRAWDRDNKVWLVSAAEADRAVAIAAHYFKVIDGRGKNANEIEDSQIEAEISQIEENQAAILEQESRIEEIIDKLNTAIGRYSFRSKSSVKGALARDRALLEHSLRNARLPIERLTELHVRGMAAALRLIEGGYKPPRGAHL